MTNHGTQQGSGPRRQTDKQAETTGSTTGYHQAQQKERCTTRGQGAGAPAQHHTAAHKRSRGTPQQDQDGDGTERSSTAHRAPSCGSATPHRRTQKRHSTHHGTRRQKKHKPKEQHDATIPQRTARHPRTQTAQSTAANNSTHQNTTAKHASRRAQSTDKHDRTQHRKAQHLRATDRAQGHNTARSGTKQGQRKHP